ncbi:hypothetical protein FGO68_gene5268 [Halteria grandinella]|uniref:VPS9 domain-containing protein n=1 Tax=Halteria grandinella TaxID=5974 RepID=A0A8J8NNZ8_HALGN|nr:hypothetical protein FGO68_gene5268 [Halteria grandinella]
MQKFTKNYPQYVELLTENDYVLALPQSQILSNCVLDDLFILDHILQTSHDGKEFTTLNGKSYVIKDKKLELQSDSSVRVDILQNDVCYTDSTGVKHFKRIMISNSLDPRFFVQQAASQTSLDEPKYLRDPYEIVQFFKMKVFLEIEESYEDFLEEIRCLKENHILMKGHERAQSKTFKKIAENLKKSLVNTKSVQEQYGGLSENMRNEGIDNLVETLIYERIGAYVRKNLTKQYEEEESKLTSKMRQLYTLYKSDLKSFNEFMGSDFKSEIPAGKCVKIFKVFFRCQLPYEMFFTLHETMLMAAEELAIYLGKPKGTVDAQPLIKYVILVILQAREELEQEGKPFNFMVRLMLMEHFTVKQLGMSEEFYSFVTFKEAENCIMDCQV